MGNTVSIIDMKIETYSKKKETQCKPLHKQEQEKSVSSFIKTKTKISGKNY
jgi:hypothetical protein